VNVLDDIIVIKKGNSTFGDFLLDSTFLKMVFPDFLRLKKMETAHFYAEKSLSNDNSTA